MAATETNGENSSFTHKNYHRWKFFGSKIFRWLNFRVALFSSLWPLDNINLLYLCTKKYSVGLIFAVIHKNFLAPKIFWSTVYVLQSSKVHNACMRLLHKMSDKELANLRPAAVEQSHTRTVTMSKAKLLLSTQEQWNSLEAIKRSYTAYCNGKIRQGIVTTISGRANLEINCMLP